MIPCTAVCLCVMCCPLQLLRQQTATGQVTGWDLVLEPYSFWWCDGVKFL